METRIFALSLARKYTYTDLSVRSLHTKSKYHGEAGMIKKKYTRDSGLCTVTFIIGLEQATGHNSFNLVGDFNNWNRTDTKLKKNKDGTFEISLTLGSGREYQFRYLVDDSHWENDWQADKYVLNPYGNEENSVILV